MMTESPLQRTRDKEERKDLKDMAARAPRCPGVYLMKDGKGLPIYVGKAKDLRKRVRSYFRERANRAMIPFLMSRVRSIEYIVTDTEKEALILENTLIKKHRPRYNVTLRDDKNFFSLRVDLEASFPRFELVRRVRKDGARYFGPYSSSAAVKETLHFLHQAVPLRTCKEREFIKRKRPCMEYEIKRCMAPCCGFISTEDYRRLLQEALLFMEGRGNNLIKDLRQRMKRASESLEYEKAAFIRDRIKAVEKTLEKQKVVSFSFKDRDVFAVYRHERVAQTLIMYIRNGRITGQRKIPLLKTREETGDVLSSLIKQYYHEDVSVPEEVIVPTPLADSLLIEEWLTEKRGKQFHLVVPERGERARMLALAMTNAENAFNAEKQAGEEQKGLLDNLKKRLFLTNIPERIECFDISNISGRYAVGSMVSFLEGKPDRERYRRFRIKTSVGPDDCAMMYEVLRRRLKDSSDLPDLIIVDGGRGQLKMALAVFEELEITGVDAIGLAKESHLLTKKGAGLDKGEDRVYLPSRKNPVYLSSQPKTLFFLQRIRDEAHRFAVTYHRRVKEKMDFRSVLDDVPGIGPQRKRVLLSHFKGLEGIRAASYDELTEVPGIGNDTAMKIQDHIHGRGPLEPLNENNE